MSTPDDVQIAAVRLSNIEAEQVLGEKCKILAEAFWAASENADLLFRALADQGWTPPGTIDQTVEYGLIARDKAYKEGYQQGLHDGRSATAHLTTSPDAWVPVSLQWRYIRAGDSFVGEGGVWHVVSVVQNANSLDVFVVHGDSDYMAPVDPDEEVSVLVPAIEADGLAKVREHLDGRIIDRSVS